MSENPMRMPESKLVPFAELTALGERLRGEGKRIVTTNGCFDLLHWGHIKYLSEARCLGDVLVCGVNSDASVRRLKGPSRPIQSEERRLLQLAGLESIDFVTLFTEDDPVPFLQRVRPHIHVKGADYQGKPIPEQAVVERLGGTVAFVPLVAGLSTTQLVSQLAGKSL